LEKKSEATEGVLALGGDLEVKYKFKNQKLQLSLDIGFKNFIIRAPLSERSKERR